MADGDCTAFKTCTKCKITKLVAEFGNQKHRKDGRNPWCRDCKSAAGKIYEAKHKERRAKQHAAWAAANPEKCRARSRAFRKRWQEADPEGYKAYNAKY